MFYAEKPQDEKEYKKIEVDSRIFYKLVTKQEKEQKRKKRYSDLIKDPHYKQQDLYRKLKMIKQFREKNGDLGSLVENWKSLITDCIYIMKNEYEVPVSEIFKIFRLEEYGYKQEDYE